MFHNLMLPLRIPAHTAVRATLVRGHSYELRALDGVRITIHLAHVTVTRGDGTTRPLPEHKVRNLLTVSALAEPGEIYEDTNGVSPEQAADPTNHVHVRLRWRANRAMHRILHVRQATRVELGM